MPFVSAPSAKFIATVYIVEIVIVLLVVVWLISVGGI